MVSTSHTHSMRSPCDVTSSGVRYLFGGDSSWDESTWTATDDRVRGGSSISHLTVHQSASSSPAYARFSGNLDTTTLGGAGFASQRTKGEFDLDLSDSIGLRLSILNTDGKKYLLTLKDEIPGRRDDGREMSGVTWEAVVEVTGKPDGKSELVFIPWQAFEATYRGRPKDDAKPLNLKSIKRVSFMMRSFFGQQEGDFSLDVESVAAVVRHRSTGATLGTENAKVAADADDHEADDGWDVVQEKADRLATRQPAPRGGWKRMFCGLL